MNSDSRYYINNNYPAAIDECGFAIIAKLLQTYFEYFRKDFIGGTLDFFFEFSVKLLLEVLLGEGQLDLLLLVLLEDEHQVVVAGLTLADRGINVDGEVHLALVLVRKQEEPHHGGARDLKNKSN